MVIGFVLAGQCPSAGAQAQPAPADLVDRLIAALPSQELLRNPPELPSAVAETALLRELNPGREAGVSAVMLDFRNCIAPELSAGTLRAMRSVIGALGANKVELLIRFYSGPDFQRVLALDPQTHALTDTQMRELNRFMEMYPLAEFAAQINGVGRVASQDQVMRTRTRQCAANKEEALGRLRLRRR